MKSSTEGAPSTNGQGSTKKKVMNEKSVLTIRKEIMRKSQSESSRSSRSGKQRRKHSLLLTSGREADVN